MSNQPNRSSFTWEGQIAGLQTLSPDEAWALACPDLLESIRDGKPDINFGKRGSQLSGILLIAAKLSLLEFVAFVLGAIVVLGGVFKSRVGVMRKARSSEIPRRWFVGFGAGAEEALFAEYVGREPEAVGRISQDDLSTATSWFHPSVLSVWREYVRAQRHARTAIRRFEQRSSRQELAIWVHVVKRAGSYAFYAAWLRRLRSIQPAVSEICFLSPDSHAFAAVAAGLPTVHMQHGLIRKSILLPKFDRVETITHEEQRHFQNRLPRANVLMKRAFAKSLSNRKSNSVLIASIYGDTPIMMQICPFLDFCANHGLEVHLRLHPRQDLDTWNKSIVTDCSVTVEPASESFEEVIERLRPSLVVSWFSTSLADALYAGVIPVTVSSSDEPVMSDMVYPLFDKCLSWRRDKPMIIEALQDSVVYDQNLTRLQGCR